MIVVLAGSMAFTSKMDEVCRILESHGIEVTYPTDGIDSSPGAIRTYNDAALQRIERADTMLVINETKHDIQGYVGANTLIEIGMAYALHKPIYLLNPYDAGQANAVELAGLITGIVGDVESWLVEAMK